MQRSAIIFGSCAQTVDIVLSVFFQVINCNGYYEEPTQDSQVTRQAKILYVSLLESVQKERGEWQGFSSSSSPGNDNNRHEELQVTSSRDLLTSNLRTHSATEQLSVLHQLLEVSFRNLTGPLVPLKLYTQHKKMLVQESLAVPPALTTLLAIRELLNLLEREVRHCLLRLLALWDLIALVSGKSQPLMKLITDKHHYVLSESFEFKNMPARKSGRHDSVAIHLLQIMVLYRDILFSDIEFILIKQELQVNSQLVEDIRNMAWSSDLESARLSEEDDRAFSDGDRSSNGDAENQIVHDEAANRLLWGQTGALETIALHSRTSSSAPSVVGEDEERSLDGGWSISSPTSDRCRPHRDEKRISRSRCMTSPRMLGAADDPLASTLKLETSSDGISSPNQGHSRLIKRIPSISSQQSLSSSTNSPTHSITSQTHSSTGSWSKKLEQRSLSFTDSNQSSDCQRNEPRVLPLLSRSKIRQSKRGRGNKILSVRLRPRRRLASSRGTNDDMYQVSKQGSQDTHRPSYLSLAASYLATPVAATTLGILATMASLAIFKMRNALHN